MKISILCCFILSFISHISFAQIFDSEQNPLSVKWRQINNKGFKIIYPTELEKDAQRMANTLGFIYPYVGASLNRQKTTIPIVFQNRGIPANGFVQLAPKKSQFNTTPPQQFDSQDWLNNLAVHELRHVAQFDKVINDKSLFFLKKSTSPTSALPCQLGSSRAMPSAPKLHLQMQAEEDNLLGSCPSELRS